MVIMIIFLVLTVLFIIGTVIYLNNKKKNVNAPKHSAETKDKDKSNKKGKKQLTDILQIKIKDNIIKGMNKMATGVHIDHNSDEIIMTDNTMHTLNRNMFLSTSATNTTIENNLVLNTNTIH